MNTKPFHAPTELETIRRFKAIQRQQAFYTSRLKKHRAEMVALRQAGASYREITLWLKQTKRLKITHTSVMRYLKQLPELQENLHAQLSQSQ